MGCRHRTVSGPREAIRGGDPEASFSPDGRVVLVARPGESYLWEPNTGKTVHEPVSGILDDVLLPCPGAVAFIPTGGPRSSVAILERY